MSDSTVIRFDHVLAAFEAACRDGAPPDIATCLERMLASERPTVLPGLVRLELEYRIRAGQPVRVEEYLRRHPQLLADQPAVIDLITLEYHVRMACSEAVTAEEYLARFPDLRTDLSTALAADTSTGATPRQIGRYQIEKLLGKGGFGLVYLAHDRQLQRLVAIKVPYRHRVLSPGDAKAYLAEARTVASLDHPNIVPVHDVGSTDDCPFFVVSKYIDGTDLATRLKHSRPSPFEAAELVATVASALHHAHKQGLVHRDVKPANILLDKSDKAYVADFGLALREEDIGKGPRYAGTPAYMSPEQARGEGHRVDGRSDLFSLGVVFYELLVGRKPFRAESQSELLEQVLSFEVRPPRQYDDTIAKELERICLKALSKRASDRYSTAKDMADDLRHFLAEQKMPSPPADAPRDPPVVVAVSTAPSGQPASGRPELSSTTPTTPHWDHQFIKIVPKGLRSFDAHDADFFLELLPGPRDRDGLPDCLRFWKARLEERDADCTFAVGLIYGPSGCGKSSMVKAGLLPRLSDHVTAVYVEADAEDTEARLLNGIRKRCPGVPADLSLKETLAAIRRGQGVPEGNKVVIVIDQFEQWLHAKGGQADAELVQALRQCDGGRLQCVVMVRDDFWLSVSRFLRDLEIRLVDGQNSALADLFDTDHAEKVLAAFGRAFGKLPESPGKRSKEQTEFLSQAVAGLAEGGKVICVRLALFAEMMKGKAWTPAALKAVGGTEGVGVTFLEETFSATTAPPEHRYHQQAARRALRALLPESGTDIKGHMRSLAELLDAAGYANRPKEFDHLIRILDGELRLLTPTDPDGKPGDDDSGMLAVVGERYYQLTHDYLVPALREWLSRKQKETRRGRAELLLAERAAVWAARPEKRHLPTLPQWLDIRWLTAKKTWTPSQARMMAKAGRVHCFRGAVLGVALALATGTGLAIWERVEEKRKATQAEGMVQAVLNADTAHVPAIIDSMAEYHKWTDPQLRAQFDQSSANSRQKLHSSLALLPVDPTQVEYLSGRLLVAEPHEVPVLRDALVPHQAGLRDKLWAAVESPENEKGSQRLRAAAALAKYDPASERWATVGERVVNDLVLENPLFLGQWSEAFRPVKGRLLHRLSEIYREQQPEHTAERSLATNLLADYAADHPPMLADLLMDADPKQFAILYPKLKEQGENCLPLLTAEIAKTLPQELPASDDKRETVARRQANAGVALLRMNQPERVWPLLKHSPDPRVRSYLIHTLSPLGADAKAIAKQLEGEKDITVRRALLLALGEFKETDFTPDERKVLVDKAKEMYRTASDPGLHAAAEWLLRTWKQETWLTQQNEQWAKDKEGREERITGIKQSVTKDKEKAPRQWYVNDHGQTMVVIPGPQTFSMGSPTSEKNRTAPEVPHLKRIRRSFAFSSSQVTVGQFLRCGLAYKPDKSFAPTDDCPAHGINWFMAATYCNILSKHEGIPEDQWCYEMNDAGYVTKPKPDHLKLTGYRLPTEAEWEYSCRGGAVTARFFGESDDLLPQYSWYIMNSQGRNWPVGTKKPNDFGLFDVIGNVFCWCDERFMNYPNGNGVTDDVEGPIAVDLFERVQRGGSINDMPGFVRSAVRAYNVPTFLSHHIGFRVARTIVP